MGRRLVLGVLLLASACSARLKDSEPTDAPKGMPDSRGSNVVPIDSPIDAYVFGPFGAATPVTGASGSGLNIDDETLNSTLTELYFAEVDAAITGTPKQLWVMTRTTAADPWGTPVMMDATFNATGTTVPQEESPRLSPDDLTIYFGRGGDIYYATRTAVGQPWTNPQPMTDVNTGNYEKWLAVCAGGYYLVSRNTGAGTATHIYEGQLGHGDSLSSLSGTVGNDISNFLSADCTTAYFASSRSGTAQIYTATRSSGGTTWSAVTELETELGTAPDNEDPWLSPDGHTMYFASERYGGTNTNKGVYMATR
jgi:hypothetical protein